MLVKQTGNSVSPAPGPALPYRAGLGLKPEHFRDIVESRPDIGFFEVHAENYMVDGGPQHFFLSRIREKYPLSIHGVGLSIGGEQPPDADHLDRLARLLERYQPEAFSEHLAWSGHGGTFLNDLLPVPYTDDTLQRICTHLDQVQSRLKRKILLENPSTYVEFHASTWPEPAFIREVVRRSGCGLLLDINNVYVTCTNHNRDARAYLHELPLEAVGEIHLAGFAEDRDGNGDRLLIDSHGAAVAADVWALYAEALARLGPVATLIERDHDIPSLEVLRLEAQEAEGMLRRCSAAGAGRNE